MTTKDALVRAHRARWHVTLGTLAGVAAFMYGTVEASMAVQFATTLIWIWEA